MHTPFQRSCSECGSEIPHDAHPAKVLCSNRCQVRRHRRLKREGTTPALPVSNQQLLSEVALLKVQILEIAATFAALFPKQVRIVHEEVE